jgi:hypothetical protein
MTHEIKQRWFISATVIAMAALYAGPVALLFDWNDAWKAVIADCEGDFSFCVAKANKDTSLSLFAYLSPFVPAALVAWLSWLLGFKVQLSDQAYPRKIIMTLTWLGIIVAGIACFFTFWNTLNRTVEELYKIPNRAFWLGAYNALAWLIAPLLFQRLIGPRLVAKSAHIAEFFLLLTVATPVVAFAVYVVRGMTKI